MPDKRLHGDKWGAVWWYDLLVVQMERAGPAFVKLAQWAASRADLFPELLCDRLGKLHSRVTPHALKHTKKVIERVFQRPFAEVFEEFNEIPIGTGAIAQVYKAILKVDLLPPSYFDPKRTPKSGPGALAPSIIPDAKPSVPTAAVAVKVLHPRVNKLIARDLAIMHIFADVITLVPGMEWVSLPEEVDVFGRMMHEQLDLRIEADNLVTFEHNFLTKKEPITFPRPLRTWSTQDILIEEYQNAVPLEMFLKNGGGPFDSQLAELGLDAFLNMLLLDNFVHSDLHPGNIMVKFTKPSTSALLKTLWTSLILDSAAQIPPTHDNPDSDEAVSRLKSLASTPEVWAEELHSLHEEGYLPELVFIDAGLVTSLNEKNRKDFLDLFRAVAEFDGYRTGQLMIERCRMPELAVDPETFALKMQHIVLNVKRKTFSLGHIKISDILTDVLTAVRQHHVKMEGDFINTVISILLLEGIGRQLNPDLDLFKSALPILRQLGRQMTTQEGMSQLPGGNTGALLKVWVWLEARELASAALTNVGSPVEKEQYVGETESLRAMGAAAPGLVPAVIAAGFVDSDGQESASGEGRPYFVSEYKDLTSLTEKSGQVLGRRLATELHRCESSKGFGFHVPTFCGATRMRNGWSETWEECFGTKIGDLLASLKAEGGYSDLCKKGEEVQKRVIPALLGHLQIEPVLLHGDLWSGNTGTDTKTGEPVIFDPSSFYGHNEADLAIARIFGGIPRSFFTTYHKHFPKTEPVDQYELRGDLYELFHYLNHTVIFGGGYAGSAMRKMNTLLNAV
ncbi:hypothetical protein EWM64_g457 [Hericium alpestre]|uniref:protein-ribulosamine 3-kinase n=1 Tax=Hericium alpestre TaxID=135208 RepID=A0A4Z0AA06_9AGAM|nr:hypothetical protein EWM64_g457 [Hericium alpestre]